MGCVRQGSPTQRQAATCVSAATVLAGTGVCGSTRDCSGTTLAEEQHVARAGVAWLTSGSRIPALRVSARYCMSSQLRPPAHTLPPPLLPWACGLPDCCSPSRSPGRAPLPLPRGLPLRPRLRGCIGCACFCSLPAAAPPCWPGSPCWPGDAPVAANYGQAGSKRTYTQCDWMISKHPQHQLHLRLT